MRTPLKIIFFISLFAGILFFIATALFARDHFEKKHLNLTRLFNQPDSISPHALKKPLNVSDYLIEGKYIQKLHLHDAVWRDVVLKDSEFRSVRFENMRFENASFHLINFQGSTMNQVLFKKVALLGHLDDPFDLPRDFDGVSMREVVFEDSVLQYIDFRNMPAGEIHFVNCQLDHVSFAGSSVKLSFENTVLQHVDLGQAEIIQNDTL